MITSVLAVVLMFFVVGGVFGGLLMLTGLSTPARSLPRHMKESRFAHSANRLVAEVDEAVRHCAIPPDKRNVLKQQAREVAQNITLALWKLYHVRKLRQLACEVGKTPYTSHVVDEAGEMEARLLCEVDRSLEVLFSVPLSLMKMGLAQGERTADRLLEELREANLRMQEVATTYGEMRTHSAAYEAPRTSARAQA